jgi:uncharacterized SAM-binding protein YcdF (DUF218 family)
VKSRAGRLIVAALAMAALAFVAHGPALRSIGQALIVEDPLAKADAIVVVAGGTPSREEAGARLYRDGLAPTVVLSNQFTPDRVRDLIALGARRFDYQGEARVVLEKHGVPTRAIVALPPPVKTTEAELKVVGEAARAHGWRRVILVTSPQHSRRVKLVWRRQASGSSPATISSTATGGANAARPRPSCTNTSASPPSTSASPTF